MISKITYEKGVFGLREERGTRPRKIRADRKHRFPWRVDPGIWPRIRVIAFNCRLSHNTVIDLLVGAALENDEIINSIYSAYPPSGNYILVRDEE